MAAGWLVAGRAVVGGTPRVPGLRAAMARLWHEGGVFAVIGAAPDLDLLVGLHSTYTHSVGAAAAVAAGAWALGRHKGARWALACGAALASHILLDWLGNDTTPPLGITALWPFSTAFYQSSLFLFPAVSRRFGEWSFVTQNLHAVLWETAILVPLAALIRHVRRTPGVLPTNPNPNPNPRPPSPRPRVPSVPATRSSRRR